MKAFLENFNYLHIALTFLISEFAFKLYINYRQFKNYKIRVIPEQLKSITNEKEFEHSQKYSADKMIFKTISSTYGFIFNITFLAYNIIPMIWNKSEMLVKEFGYDNEIIVSNIFIMAILMFNNIIGLPFDYYETFFLEEKYGFNKTTKFLFIKDKIIQNLLLVVLTIPICSALIFVIQWAGEHFWIYALGLVFGFSMVLITIYPTFIAPLFNKYKPVEGEIKDAIMELADKVKFPATKIYEVDSSKRSGHMNAYFYGFFKNKRIVLYDTLIKEMSIPELLSVLAHEFSHYFCNHTTYLIIFQQIYLAQFFYLFGFFINDSKLYNDFGFSQPATIIGLLLFQMLNTPFDTLFSFIMNVFSRKFEYQADEHALKFGCEHLIPALVKLHVKDRAALIVDPLYSAMHYTHPTLLERIDYIKKVEKTLSAKNK
ncbi:CAAX prenyl protease [Tieghemostelium lacteum]|uniref:CAAX prenyl protease n=1 Tax=Tieghemostelium lacteum TaxID=361077 RepID=A0A152A6M7_TIELA|nr:CAAX prenyl protease [Tieghemostelium lacteum]|eukprot:KYR01870.1 CAAX prenyl protease [Tieghemostelium lacteum]